MSQFLKQSWVACFKLPATLLVILELLKVTTRHLKCGTLDFYLEFILNNNKRVRSFKRKENIYKKEVRPTMVSATKASSVSL